jgi:hypothetical protein
VCSSDLYKTNPGFPELHGVEAIVSPFNLECQQSSRAVEFAFADAGIFVRPVNEKSTRPFPIKTSFRKFKKIGMFIKSGKVN